MQYQGKSLAEACRIVIQEKLTALGGEGGLIAVDWQGKLELVLNCSSMLRAWKDSDGNGDVRIWP